MRALICPTCSRHASKTINQHCAACDPSGPERYAVPTTVDDRSALGDLLLSTGHMGLAEQADAILSAGFRRDPGWIACADRYPTRNGHYWTYSRKAQENLRYRTDLGFQRYSGDDDCYFVTTEPTHWMPLPLPPAPDDNDKAREGMA